VTYTTRNDRRGKENLDCDVHNSSNLQTIQTYLSEVELRIRKDKLSRSVSRSSGMVRILNSLEVIIFIEEN
jgi:hypothetical protein